MWNHDKHVFFCEKPRSHVGTARTCTPSPTLKTLIVLGGTCQICPLQWSSLSGFQNINQDFANVFKVWCFFYRMQVVVKVSHVGNCKTNISKLWETQPILRCWRLLIDISPSQRAAATTTSYLHLTSSSTSTASTCLYQYLAAFPTSVSASKFPSRFFLIFQDSRSLDSHPPKTGSVFRAMVACIVQDWKEVSERPKNLEETTKLKKKSWVETTPGRCPQVFQLQTLQTSDLEPFLTLSHISGPKNAYLSNKLGNLNLGKSGWRIVSKHYPISFPFFSNAIPRKSIPPTRNSHVHGIHCFT